MLSQRNPHDELSKSCNMFLPRDFRGTPEFSLSITHFNLSHTLLHRLLLRVYRSSLIVLPERAKVKAFCYSPETISEVFFLHREEIFSSVEKIKINSVKFLHECYLLL